MKYYGITDRGNMRKNNQDSYVIASNLDGDVFAIVCDGIGGARGGDVASRLAVSHMSEVFSETSGLDDVMKIKKWVRDEILSANRMILELSRSDDRLKGMGTTFAAVMITKAGRFVINIGDSRVYGYRKDSGFRQLTVDHTLVEDMIVHGELTREEAVNFPRKNVLTNALGVWDSIRYDIDTHTEPLDGFLICSDGLHGYVPLERMEQIVLDHDGDPSLRARKLVRAALEAGGYDNITVVLLEMEDSIV